MNTVDVVVVLILVLLPLGFSGRLAFSDFPFSIFIFGFLTTEIDFFLHSLDSLDFLDCWDTLDSLVDFVFVSLTASFFVGSVLLSAIFLRSVVLKFDMRDLPFLLTPGFIMAVGFLRDAFGLSFFREADLAARFWTTTAPSGELFLVCLLVSLAFKGRVFLLTSCDFLPAAVRAILKEDKSYYVSSRKDTGYITRASVGVGSIDGQGCSSETVVCS